MKDKKQELISTKRINPRDNVYTLALGNVTCILAKICLNIPWSFIRSLAYSTSQNIIYLLFSFLYLKEKRFLLCDTLEATHVYMYYARGCKSHWLHQLDKWPYGVPCMTLWCPHPITLSKAWSDAWPCGVCLNNIIIRASTPFYLLLGMLFCLTCFRGIS